MRTVKLIFLLPLFYFLQVTCGDSGPDFSKGGRIYIMEVDAEDFLYRTSDQRDNQSFADALQKAHVDERIPNEKFIRAFARHYAGMNPGASLMGVFSYGDPENFTAKMSESEVIDKLVKQYNEAVEVTQKMLTNRLKQFVDPSNFRLRKDEAGRIVVEVGGKQNFERLHKILNTSVELGFYETYSNTEAYPMIQKLDSLFFYEMYPNLDTSDHNPLHEKKRNPLFSILFLAIREQGLGQYYWESGCRIGMAKPSDTAQVNKILHSKTAHEIFPKDIHFLWAQKPEQFSEPEPEEEYVSLYSVKAESIERPSINGNLVAETRVDENPKTKQILVNVKMNKRGTEQWGVLTQNNVGKAVAIVMNKCVISSPVVENPIPNGIALINGDFTFEEATDLSLLLKSGGSVPRFRLVEEKEMKMKENK